jgi:endonuclease/exonuclease/phosphatase family metal-dependent hydrolase
LQEMDEAGVDRIARALGFNYAYYPASIHPVTGNYFGPAVLSRWPIERSWKLLLPHGGWTRGQRRTATAAMLRVRETRLLVYAVRRRRSRCSSPSCSSAGATGRTPRTTRCSSPT